MAKYYWLIDDGNDDDDDDLTLIQLSIKHQRETESAISDNNCAKYHHIVHMFRLLRTCAATSTHTQTHTNAKKYIEREWKKVNHQSQCICQSQLMTGN